MENPFENFEAILNNFDNFCNAFEEKAAEAFNRGDQNNGQVIRAATAKLGGETPRAIACLLYTSPSPRDVEESRMPSSA